MSWFEYILVALFWAVQIGITAVIALVLGMVVRELEQLVRKKKVKFLPRALVAFVLVCIMLAVLALNPPVVCPEKLEGRFTQEQHRAVQAVSRGLYSVKIPLIPLWVEVTELENFIIDGNMERGVEFTIHYLWFGSLGMRYLSGDGYSITKPLTGL